MGTVTSATIRLQGIEMDILEEKTLSEIVSQYAFADTGALRDFLVGQNRRDLWSRAQRLKPSHLGRPAKEAPPARPGRVPVLHQASPPTSPPKEPVMAIPEEPQGVDGPEVTAFWPSLARATTAAQDSPKKRTVAKADKLLELAHELISIVEGEKQEIEALQEIKHLEAQLAEARAKLAGKKPGRVVEAAPVSAAVIRAWANEHFDGHVPTVGKLTVEIHEAYAAAHRG